MAYEIKTEIARFCDFTKRFRKAGYEVTEPCAHGLGIIGTQGSDRWSLALLGIVHGNEVAGVAVINELLDFVLRHDLHFPGSIAVALGNPDAALENKRFLESDLNRSFAHKNPTTKEQKRAKELMRILEKTDYLLDLHQTTHASKEPFFIFPYSAKSLTWARAINSELAVVTHWGRSYSKDGLCSDEFTNSCGGTGITAELGQNGFGTYQIAAGVRVSMAALAAARSSTLPVPAKVTSQLYTWSEVIDYPKEGKVELTPGFVNFQEIKKNQIIGRYESGENIIAKEDGKILFPYYAPSPKKDRVKPPAELCRLLRLISPADLPHS